MNGETEVIFADDAVAEVTPVTEEALPEIADTTSADAENGDISQDAVKEKAGGKRLVYLVCRIVAAFLAFVGVASYAWVGYKGAEYFGKGNFEKLALSAVFGGSVTLIEAVPLPPAAETPEKETVEQLKISREDIGCDSPDIIYNETGYTVPDSVSASAVPHYRAGDTVLIIHTHGTEAFAPEGIVPADEDFRSDDISQNIVAVGAAFAEILEAKGVNVIHCAEMFDEKSYVDAYKRSGAAVVRYMEEHPEISYVIDIHRDSVVRSDGTVVGSDGGSGAQLMLVMGTDEMGADFPRWRENFAFGRLYQQMLYERNADLIRHMNLRGASFNQQLCENYILLEVGTGGNTLAEAVASAEIAAEVFADMITGK